MRELKLDINATMSSGTQSPSSLFLNIAGASPQFISHSDEESISICPLLTPSPTVHFHHPLAASINEGYDRQQSPSSEDTEISTVPPSIAPTHETTEKQNHNKENLLKQDSSSSSSCSVIHDSTATAQLLNYLTHASDPSSQEKGGIRSAANLLGLGNSAQQYGFVGWNWPVIRKWCFWGVMSLTVACVCVIIGYMTTIPRSCDPPRAWFQGSLIYQIFPPSFQDSDGNGIGDLKGVISRISYFEKLKVKGVRLSYIFPSNHYPEYYEHVYNMTQIDKSIGDFDDFRVLVESLHSMNISVVIDLPLYPFFEELRVNNQPSDWEDDRNEVKHVIVNNHILISPMNKTRAWSYERGEITDVLTFWLNNGVDGFYMLGLEKFINDDRFIPQVIEWKTELHRYNQAFDKILICSEEVVNNLQEMTVTEAETKLNIVMKSFDLINVKIEPFTKGTRSIAKTLNDVHSGTLYSSPGYPWVYWTSGDMNSNRLASKAPFGNVTLAAILTTMVLPGTAGIFYGDEIGLLDIHDPENERSDLKHAHHLGPMHWSESLRGFGFSQGAVLPWLPASQANLPLSTDGFIISMSSLKDANPGLYMNAIWKNEKILPNTAIRYVDSNLITIERYYPRRHSYLLIANLGHIVVEKDLSSHYYGGIVMLDTQRRPNDYMTFHKIKLSPGEVILAKLDK